MLYVSKIDGSTVQVTNTENDTVVQMNIMSLALCCHQTGLTVIGVCNISQAIKEKYENEGYRIVNILNTVYYAMRVVQEENLPLSAHDKYLTFKRYLGKCKLTDTKPLAYSTVCDDITQVIGNIGFCLDDSCGGWSDFNNIYSKFWYNKDADELCLTKYGRVYKYKVSDLQRYDVPKFVDYVSFKCVHSDTPCVIKFPRKRIVVLEQDYASPNLVLKIPKDFAYLYKDCRCVKLEY